MKSLVLAEKPSVARELARVLGCHKKSKSFIEGDSYVVTWAMGHLVELADPEAYDEKFKAWKLDFLPMLPEKMKHKVIGKTSFQFKAIKKLFQRNDINELIIATDAGREGELVARWMMRLGGWKGLVKRLWISSQTDKAIKDGFANLSDGQKYVSLFRAAESRAEADWLVGINATRALTCKFDARLSTGRVQTPTLAIIAAREEERRNFVPKNFWQIGIDFGDFEAIWTGPNGNKRIFSHEEAQAILQRVQGQTGKIERLSRKKMSQPPPQAYDLTELQRDANKQLNFSAKQTLRILQALYERHKIVTYPRTDSRYITTDMVPTLDSRVKALSQTSFRNQVKALQRSSLNTGGHLVNNKKVSDHHAVIPTEEPAKEEQLSNEESALWRLIVRRFLAVLSQPFVYEKMTLNIKVGDDNFTVTGTKSLEKGWTSIEHNSRDDNDDERGRIGNWSQIHEGKAYEVKKGFLKNGQTSPPARFTEASLLTAMEKPYGYIKDEALKKVLKATGTGLGTPATRADIIEKLLSKYFIERQGKELIPTSAGLELLDVCPDLLTEPALTAKWEQRLRQIEMGSEQAGRFLKDIRELTKILVKEIKESQKNYKPRNLVNKECPLCGKKMMSVKGKKGYALLVCPSFACGYEDENSGNKDFMQKPSKREKQISRTLLNKYSDHSPETSSFGDLLKAAMEKKNK